MEDIENTCNLYIDEFLIYVNTFDEKFLKVAPNKKNLQF